MPGRARPAYFSIPHKIGTSKWSNYKNVELELKHLHMNMSSPHDKTSGYPSTKQAYKQFSLNTPNRIQN